MLTLLKALLNSIRTKDPKGQSGLPLTIQNYIDCEVSKATQQMKTETKQLLNDELKKRWGPWDKMLSYVTQVLVAVGIVIGIGSCIGGKEYLRTTVVIAATNMFTSELTNQIAAQFKEPRISNVVVAVLSSKTTNLMAEQVRPAISNFQASLSGQLKILKHDSDAMWISNTTTVDALKDLADIYLLLARAQNDDRPAFDTLIEITQKPNHPMYSLAYKATVAIVDNVNFQSSFLFETDQDPWVGTSLNAESAKMADFELRFAQSMNKIQRLTLLRQFYRQARFPLEERLALLMGTLKSANSILVLNQTCHLIDEEAKLGRNFMGVPQYYEWYQKRLQKNLSDKK